MSTQYDDQIDQIVTFSPKFWQNSVLDKEIELVAICQAGQGCWISTCKYVANAETSFECIHVWPWNKLKVFILTFLWCDVC